MILYSEDVVQQQTIKLQFYDMMVKYGLHHHAYLDIAKHYHKVWETPSIKEDVNGKGKTVSLTFPTLPSNLTLTSFKALEHIVYYVALAPHNNEQSDMMHRLFADPALEKLEVQWCVLRRVGLYYSSRFSVT